MQSGDTEEVVKDALYQFGEKLVHTIASRNGEGAAILTLSGDLGAGKTALVQSIASALGITEPVVSPTFVIMKQYATVHEHFDTLVHIDAYRIDNITELLPLHFEALLEEARTLICIEWPERIASAIPSVHHHVSLSIVDDTTRRIRYDYKH